MYKSLQQVKKDSAFTMVEAVIVLVVISLLVSVIVGGISMIKHGRMLVFIDELRTYTTATKNFKSNKKRWPGDKNRTGKIGLNSGQIYDNGSFGNPYTSSNTEYGVPTDRVGPFVELFQTGYLDFEPKKNKPSGEKLDWNNGGAPVSKAFEQFQCHYQYRSSAYGSGIPSPNIGYVGSVIACHYKGDKFKNYISLDIMKNIDKKLDDGIFNKGIIRGYCNSKDNSVDYVSYEQNNPKKYICNGLAIHLDNNNLQ